MPLRSADEFFEKHKKHSAFLLTMRNMLIELGFDETVKWGSPVYMVNGQNLVSLGIFKNHKGIWLFEGGLLKDPAGILSNAQEGKTKAMRHIKLNHDEEPDYTLIRSYLLEAADLARKGIRFKKAKPKKVPMPPELKKVIDQDQALSAAFNSLTSGRQKEYKSYISEAKRESTLNERLKKISPMILEGKGLNDKYRK